jgi:hypothetical protein
MNSENVSNEAENPALNKGDVSGSLPSEIYLTYDECDGDVFCAFINKEQCKKEAEESGCGMQTVRLIWKQ